jgi:hypothetical protein
MGPGFSIENKKGKPIAHGLGDESAMEFVGLWIDENSNHARIDEVREWLGLMLEQLELDRVAQALKQKRIEVDKRVDQVLRESKRRDPDMDKLVRDATHIAKGTDSIED